MQVVKLGGSLLSSGALPGCLQRLAAWRGPILLAPGGGVFADQVRLMQQRYAFDDRAAHYMAILAMQQMAYLCQALQPGFKLCENLTDLPAVGVCIWSPQIAQLDQAGIPASWRVTSDSLAAWAAAEINAEQLILVKAAHIDAGAGWPALQEQGVVDAAFADFAGRLRCPVRIIHQDDLT